MHKTKLMASLCVSALLVACGGGGSSGGTPTSSSSVVSSAVNSSSMSSIAESSSSSAESSAAESSVSSSSSPGALTISGFIVVDQFGYLPDAKKIAVIRDPQTGFDAAQVSPPAPPTN